MKHIASVTCLVVGIVGLAITAPSAFAEASQQSSAPIPMDQLGAVAGKQYQGDGLSVIATPDGASLRCAFQRLEGQVTREGLWLSSTADNNSGERFRVRAVSVGRTDDFGFGELFPLNYVAADVRRLKLPDAETQTQDLFRASSRWLLQFGESLPPIGSVSVTDNVARFIRPGLTEEYTVSVDGVRQDFIIEQRPEGDGELRVALDVTGARAEPLVNGARLVLDGSGRKLAYNRLRVTDATGRELPARMEVTADRSDLGRAGSPLPADGAHGVTRPTLALLVDDAAAIYPVRIDPTFSDADWTSLGGFPGANDTVYAAVSDSFGNLFIGGVFTNVGSAIANRIAKWDGAAWSALGSGMNGTVRALAIDGTNLYAGGEFSVAGGIPAYGIAKWNGAAWSFLGPGLGYGTVYALAVQGTNLYAGGSFSTAGLVTANSIAKWNGSAWSALGLGMTNIVRALAVLGNNVYAGGDFTFAGGVSTHRIAKWDGSSWSSVGSGMNNAVHALAVSGGELYAGGWFSRATNSGGASVPVSQVARWDGSSWFSMGSGLGGLPVYALAVSGSTLYAAGQGSTLPHNIAKWDGLNWVNLGSGIESYSDVYALAVSGTNLYAGGDFILAGVTPVNRITKWNGNTWSAIGSGINGSVSALAVMGGSLYAGGTFTTAGSVSANRIAKWNGNTWSALGAGVNGIVNALAVIDSDLYVGGSFTSAGGIIAQGLAKWNGVTWTMVGLGLRGAVNSLTVSGTNLFVAGSITHATNSGPAIIITKSIAKWDGISWSALGTGTGGTIYALAVSGTNLYAGGKFMSEVGVGDQSIAKWDGNAWSSLGSGMGGNFSPYVYALAAFGPYLYAGGGFTTAGGVPAFRIARWNGNSWAAVGTGMNNTVNALAMSGIDVYAGGYFTTAGGVSANGIAKCHYNTWSALGSGVSGLPNGNVKALTVSGTDLFVGGEFITAGNKVSAYVTKGNIGPPPRSGQFSGMAFSPITGFSFTFSGGEFGYSYRIQTSPSLAADSWTDYTNFTYTAPVVITVPVAGNTNRFFRAITP